ncbi:hypothetical protein [Kribbella yunnanensis]
MMALGGCAGKVSVAQNPTWDATAPTSSEKPAAVDLPTGCEQQNVMSLCQTYDVSGGMAVQTNVTVYAETGNPNANTESTTCEKLANNTEGFAFGGPQDGMLAGQSTQLYFSAPDYKGPGQYPAGGAYIGEFQKDNGGSATFEVKPDGSGVVTISGLQSHAGDKIDGTIKWTCVEAKK